MSNDQCPKCGRSIEIECDDAVQWHCPDLNCDGFISLGDLRRQLSQAQAEIERLWGLLDSIANCYSTRELAEAAAKVVND